MSITVTQSADGSELVIKIQGRFDFSVHQSFRNAYENVKKEPTRYTIDMKDTSYIDSSALGMLLLLRDHAGGEAADISIVHCNADIKKILTISNFEQLFKIS